MLDFNNVFIAFIIKLKMAEKIPDQKKKVAFLEDILNFAKKNFNELLINEGKKRLMDENGKILFVSDHAPMDEGCHIYLKLDKNNKPFFHVKKTMHYNALDISKWDNKDCLTAKETLEYAQRYFPINYDTFTEQVKLEF